MSDDGKVTNRIAAGEIYEGADHLGDAVSSDRFNPEPAWSPDGTRISYTERSRKFFSGKLKVIQFDQATGLAKGTRRFSIRRRTIAAALGRSTPQLGAR